ncbi:16S rRNA (uracil(1498)-N(3))-methyltransferase [Paraliobacillus sediminis]|uniref:16S rRNA (uracil(1498)-N(3))-methyltransferase n=1 Tax=Paraliobacillus sediminis TaxID=1885916 RepID=UPI000E3CD9C5|nr:16S rRNA (uracil(1498)-N(3))-methyltransferase [Paraliobacillus sediminis]
MQRYFVTASGWSDAHVTITDDAIHHITRVMRMEIGDKIICNHSEGKAAICVIKTISEERIVTEIVEWQNQTVELPVRVTIAQGLPKGDKLELILQKGTELGAAAFIPLQAERSIVKWDNKKANKKNERFKKIIKEASEQSHRTLLPKMEKVASLQDVILMSASFEHKLVAYEETARDLPTNKLSHFLNQMAPSDQVLLCIGPEGGFSQKEINELHNADFQSIRLGPRILRTETAALYALASISYHFEEL